MSKPFLPLDMLKNGAWAVGFDLSDGQLELLDRFASMLAETNRKFNLTRIVEPQDIVTNHYLDSLLFLRAADTADNARVIDIGAGAGFPGIPMKVARPDLIVTLLDATAKKVSFMSYAVAALGLADVELLHGRAEDLGHQRGRRENYDVACARALADLTPLVELCLPFVKVGGRLIASKGPEIDEELAAAKPMIGQLGGMVEKVVKTHIPGTDVARRLVVISKVKQTPPRFPRQYARIIRTARS
jgi:16S rRNA (guanine527-N7)-methyltransferase